MAHVKFFDIPEHLNIKPYELTFDGDKSDKRLHVDNHISWHEPNERAYEEIESEINNFSIIGSGWELYSWCDTSGFDWWKEDTNYIQISIAFDSEKVDIKELPKIKNAIEHAIYKFEDYESYYLPDQ